MTAATPIRALQTPRSEGNPTPRRIPPQSPARTSPPAHTGPTPVLLPIDELSEVRAVTRGTVQAAMEVLAGIRPVHQLARRLDPRCLAALQHRACLIRREINRTGNPDLARLHRNSVVRSVRVCEVAAGIFEASAVVVDDVRARAVAVRLERGKQVWRVTELVIG
ncbi:Rv3235 family protein [Arthrobacter sp. ZGTC412]|uniref:Rv3235 family protein n=1 Tax=Arthrobacter sp. ZGTC412 TaxID=2058900 RepID=UPI000CE372C1|nr:Rv3235 family protein [Arthrobacter sp. ZGTC412]